MGVVTHSPTYLPKAGQKLSISEAAPSPSPPHVPPHTPPPNLVSFSHFYISTSILCQPNSTILPPPATANPDPRMGRQ